MAADDPRHDRFFRALLKLFPAEFRGDFGRQMAADFHDQRDEAARRGRPGAVASLWLRTALDAIRRVPQEHVEVFRRDASYAIRMLRKRPASTITVVLSLAIGIGLNTALFSVVRGVLWQSLPFPDSDRLVRVTDVSTKAPGRTWKLTNGEFADLRDRTQAFGSMGAGDYTTQTIVEPGEPEALPGMTVTEGFFETLRVQPILGRAFTPEEYARAASLDLDSVRAGRDRLDRHDAGQPYPLSAIVISHALWQRRFLGRSDVIGQQLRLASGVIVEVVGVMGPDIDVVTNAWVPQEWWMPQPPSRTRREGQTLDVIARLAPGQTLQGADADLRVVGADEARAFPQTNRDRSFAATPLLDTIVTNVRAELLFLFGAVACVLLVTCVNVIHLFLANAAGRRVELATRVALGATRGHLIRQTLAESALLALAGGTGGLLLAAWGVPLLTAAAHGGVMAAFPGVATEPIALPRVDAIHVDGFTLAFAGAVSLGVAWVCGLVASLPLARLSPWTALADGRSGTTVQGRRVRSALTVCEIAVALMLVVASVLMVRTIRSLGALDLGFDPRGAMTTTLPRPASLPLDDAELARLHASDADVIAQVRQLPGVVAAGVGGSPMGLRLGVGGVTVGDGSRDVGMAGLAIVSVGYLEALGARLKAGRFFTADDHAGAPAVAILGESTARRFWPTKTALGQTLRLPGGGPVRVVGVVADMAEFGLIAKAGGIYLPHLQSSYVGSLSAMLIRTNGDPQTLVPAIKTIIRRVNPEAPFPGVTTLQDEIDRATAPRRFVLGLIGLFSVLGVALAMIGVYGVVAESVAERVREIGVRIALGAQRADLVRMVLARGTRMVVAGLGIGLIGALALSQAMASMVFGVSTIDPLSYAVACGALAAAALAACAIPARRATRLDPIVALRTE